MMTIHTGGRPWLTAAIVAAALGVAGAQDSGDTLASAFERREVLIPMRDGAKLFTVVLTPKRRSAEPLPFILSRTPYGTGGWGGTEGIAYGFKELMEDGYVFVFQDIRGRYKSTGEFVMNRAPCPTRGPGCVDEATDTWDTIEWLLANVPNNNGKVGQLGISYPGWLTNASAFEPHPALKALSPQATMGDAWMGDDFFHQGAFRLSYGLEYAWEMEATSDMSVMPAPGRFDTYDWYRSFPTLELLAESVNAMAWPTWRRFTEHPAYDAEWQARSLPARLQAVPLPTLSVGGWWDQEDLYGPQATYAALERADRNGRNFVVIGPWSHGQWFVDAGESLGNAKWGSATAEYFRKDVEAKWFRWWLKGKGDGRFPEATVFDAGAREWRTFDKWPAREAERRGLYLQANGGLSFEAPTTDAGFDEYVSDPAHPIPYRPRPVEWTYDPRGSRWSRWMTEDQRFVDGRPDVLTWQTAPLTSEVTIAGNIVATLFASTTGSDADWVVKLVDVFPDEGPDVARMGGYELMVAGDIMRGRYRTSWERPSAIPSNTVVPFTVDLHQQAYTFEKGHRMMVQVQSTWFPLYDRNPQTFVPNIFLAKPSDFRAQTHRIHRSQAAPSHVDLDVLPGGAK
ncbi:MAG: CocE/NonD family hydrolase [Vicinamibacterales bacterium]